MIVAIDGPAGAGKSTVAREVARRLNFTYIDTGALYRAVALSLQRDGFSDENSHNLEERLSKISINLQFQEGIQRIFLGEEEVTEAIRAPEISRKASDCAKLPEVRGALLEMQRNFARQGSCVLDGRDIGTVVLPQADVKIFLTAAPEVRAQRRFLELSGKFEGISYQKILEEVHTRDIQDETRAVAPLKPAQDSVLLDASTLDFSEVVARVIMIIELKKS